MNHVYKVIWSAVLRLWVVASEFAKGKKKSCRHKNSPSIFNRLVTQKPLRTTLSITTLLIAAILNSPLAYAISVDECVAMGTDCVQVSTPAELQVAISSSSRASTILLTANITIPSGGYLFFLGASRPTLTIDGGSLYNITYSNVALTLGSAATTANPATLNIVNVNNIISTSSAVNQFIVASSSSVRLLVNVDNINAIPDGKLITLGSDAAGGAPNNSPITIGNITNDINMTFGTLRQMIVGSNITFTGRFHVNQLAFGSFPAVLWNNDTPANSIINLTSTADVRFNVFRVTPLTSQGRLYNINIEDGARLEVQTVGNAQSQNLLGVENLGLQIGSYSPISGFGSGATLILVQPPGNGISNTVSTNATALYFNGPTSNNDVIYNLAPGSLINVSGATNSGIIANKTTGTGNIYIRSGAVISNGTDDVSTGIGISVNAASSGNVIVRNEAGGIIRKLTGINVTGSGSGAVTIENAGAINSTATGVAFTHNGTGNAELTNSGTITSSNVGLALGSSVAGKVFTVNNTDGVINATDGTAINVLNNTVLNIMGGTLTTSGSANGITFAAANTGSHTVTDTTFNINGTGRAIVKSDATAMTLQNTRINLIDSIGFDNLTHVYFADDANGRNAIAVTGTGSAIAATNTQLAGWSPAALDLNISGAGTGLNTGGGGVDLSNANLEINVSHSGGTGLLVDDGATDNTTTIGENVGIHAASGTAIRFAGAAGKTLINQGEIDGVVVFDNSDANTVINNGTLAGSLTTGSGDDTLTLNANSNSQGTIDLGDGSNRVDIANQSSVAAIQTGSGDDIFSLSNLTPGNTYLGVLNAGGGNNTLNFTASTDILDTSTRLQNFATINFIDTDLTLTDANTLLSGTVNLDVESRLAFGLPYNGIFAGTLQGTGDAEVLAQANVTLQNASTFAGIWRVAQQGELSVSNINQLGSASLALDGTLFFDNVSFLDRSLTGSGLFSIDNGNNAFDFGAGVGSAFAGTVDLQNATFALDGLNTTALSNATLRTSAGSVTTVSAPNQQIGALVLNGGITHFDAGSQITTDTLGVLSASTVQVDPIDVTPGNLLDGDEGVNLRLVQSGNSLSASELALLTLQSSTGNSLGTGSIKDFVQGGNVVARNTYNFILDGESGLSVDTRLTHVDLQSGQTLTLSSAGASDTTLSAQLTGTGNLAIGADNSTLTLSNDLNDYTGSTTVQGGTLSLGSDNALGQTSQLTLNGGTQVDLGGNRQTIGALDNSGSVALGGGTLSIENGGVSNVAGGLSGSGTLSLNGGTLSLNAANSGLSAAIAIDSGAALTLNAGGAQGSGTLDVSGALAMAAADTINNVLTGDGAITTMAAVTLGGINSFSGTHTIDAVGALTVGATSNLGTASVNLTDSSAQLIFSGLSGVVANRLIGTTGTVRVDNGAAMALSGDNSGFAGEFALDGNSTLSVGDNRHLGSGAVDIASGSQLEFDGLTGALSNTLSGAGSWALSGSTVTLSNALASAFTGAVRLSGGSTLSLDAANRLNDATAIDIAAVGDTLTINNAGDFTFNHALTGSGLISIYNGTSAVDFGAGVGSAFAGTVDLQNATFALDGLNTTALSNATLRISAGSVTTVSAPDQQIGALVLNGGTQVDLGGNRQTIGALDNSGSVALGGGTLSIENGGVSNVAGGLSGSGTLNLNGGTLNLNAANSGLSAAIAIDSGALLTLNAGGAQGSGTLDVSGALALAAADTVNNILTGDGAITTTAAVTLGGINSFSGTHTIDAGGALTVGATSNLGTASVNLTDSSAQLIFNGLSGAVANRLIGTTGTVRVDNGAAMALSGDNSGFAGEFALDGNSTLSVGDNRHLGSGAVDIASGSQLEFDGLTGALSNTLSGAGSWALSGSTVTLSNALASAFTGAVRLSGGSTLSLDAANRLNDATAIDIAADGDTLSINNAGDFTFNHVLTGDGVLNIRTNDNTFAFGNAVGTAFTGQVNLQNTLFTLSGVNTTSNVSTVLNLQGDSYTSVGDGEQDIGDLWISGGTLIFDHITDNNGIFASEGTVDTEHLYLNGSGTIRVNLPLSIAPSLEGLSVMGLDSGKIIVELVEGEVSGTSENLTLTDGSSTPITADYFQDIHNSGSSIAAARGTFKYGLTTGDDQDGLYVNYSLTSLALLTTDADALVLQGLSRFNDMKENALSAQITGSGDLAITEEDAGAIIVISGENNLYSGKTLVHSGTLKLGAHSALGNTSNLVIDRGASVDMNGFTQTVVALNSDVGSDLGLAGGTLTVSNGGNVAGELLGNGALNLTGGTLNISSNNTDFNATTTLGSAATVHITQANGLGKGDIQLDGALQLDGAEGGLGAATFSNTLHGAGQMALLNGAEVTLGADNSEFFGLFTTQTGTRLTANNASHFGGASVNNAGTLVLDTDADWRLTTPINGTGNLVKQGDGTVYLGDAMVSGTTTTVASGALLLGTPAVSAVARTALVAQLFAVSNIALDSDVIVNNGATYGGKGDSNGNVTNQGTLLIGRAALGGDVGDFVINGNYTGQTGSHIVLQTVLAGDDSSTDKLVITGDSAGTSDVTVMNMDGKGAKTTNGIKVIDITGRSDAVFTLRNRVQAALAEYFLYQGTPTDTTDGSWYLRSDYRDQVYTPESGGFVANLAAARALFNTRLTDIHMPNRLSLAGQNGVATGEQSDGQEGTSLWLRQVKSRNTFDDTSGQLATTSNRYVAQLGGEVFDTQFTEKDRFGLGVMAGYGRATGSTHSRETGYKASNKLTGYMVGVYGTWYANAMQRHSPYLHGWLRYDWFDASVKSNTYDSGTYSVSGVGVSLEGGYPVNVYQGEKNQTFITPSAQLTFNRTEMRNVENNGTAIKQKDRNNGQTRVGVTLSNDTTMSRDTHQMLTTYLDVSWIHQSGQPEVMSEGQHVQQAGSQDIAEVKIGVEGQLTKNLSMWGNVSQQFGGKGYDDKAATLGVQYRF